MLRFLFAVPILVVLVSTMFAQDQEATARAAAGCGPKPSQLDVKTAKDQHPVAQPEPDKALVYVFQDMKRDANVTYLGAATTRVGVDASWVGANHGKSYFFFPVDPGEHHLCIDWQSSNKNLVGMGYAASFTAEAGKVYYFRAKVDERLEREGTIELDLVDSAEGQFLVSTSALSKSTVKK